MKLLTTALVVLLLCPPSSTQVDDAARRVLNRRGYQTRLPNEEAEAVQPQPSRRPTSDRRPSTGRSDGSSNPGLSLPSAATLTPIGIVVNALLYLVAGVAVFLAAAWLVRLIQTRSHRKTEELVQTIGPGQGGHSMGDVPPDAQELAAKGQFGPAIHALLLGALFELGRRGARDADSSLTSREILHQASLREPTMDALQGMVEAVEVCHFGGREPDQREFLRCNELSEQFDRSLEGAKP